MGVSISGRSTGASVVRDIEGVQRHARAAEVRKGATDRLVPRGPIGLEGGYPELGEARRTDASFSATASFTWQLRHHAAVKSTKTGRPSALNSANASSLQGRQS